MTQIELARQGNITDEVNVVAQDEGIEPEELARRIADGQAVITLNRVHTNIRPLGIGRGLRVKVNANLGTSRDAFDVEEEINKTQVAIEAGADTIMDLSTGGDLPAIRRKIMSVAKVPIGTVPIYEAVARAMDSASSFCEMSPDDIFEVIEEHLKGGVDFLTVHCGVNLRALACMEDEGRIMDVVSRGGALTIAWMRYHEKDNPLYTGFDRLLDLAYEYDATLSLGDGFRPGATADASDRAQIQELITLGQLQQRALKRGVQVMIEGPGHVPMDQVQANVLLQKRLCHGAPFYVLGPLVTDVAPGYDHITGAIGGALAAWAGADFLCYVTPAEHLRLPKAADVREGVIASKIAAVAADLARGNPKAKSREQAMSRCRKALDWQGMYDLAIDPETARASRSQLPSSDDDVCSMCGEFCAIKVQQESLKKT
ncbi:MAG: phosphomethylpyrimidine synthase ThiC [Deltaproteobacteria bacterium]|nr:phosphomethylpyrimidine synthase ThiC [Deltaproteobacteria bacterium]